MPVSLPCSRQDLIVWDSLIVVICNMTVQLAGLEQKPGIESTEVPVVKIPMTAIVMNMF